MPPRARKPTLARLVSRKKATVRRAMKAVGRPPRRRIQAPSARPPAPPTESTELAASSDSPISVLVRQLIRRQKTPRKTSTYPAQEPSWSSAANAIHSGCAPVKRSRSEPSPGTSTISATTPSDDRAEDQQRAPQARRRELLGERLGLDHRLEVLDDPDLAGAHSQTATAGMATFVTDAAVGEASDHVAPVPSHPDEVPWNVLSNRAEAVKPAAR